MITSIGWILDSRAKFVFIPDQEGSDQIPDYGLYWGILRENVITSVAASAKIESKLKKDKI